MATVYQLPAGKDPQWDAWLAQEATQSDQAQRNRRLTDDQANVNYNLQMQGIAKNAALSRQQLMSNLEGRGVLRSGEALRREGEGSANVLDAQNQAMRTRMTTGSNDASALQRELANLAVQNETQIAASKSRLAAVPPPPPTVIVQPSVAAPAVVGGGGNTSAAAMAALMRALSAPRPAPAAAPAPAPVAARPAPAPAPSQGAPRGRRAF